MPDGRPTSYGPKILEAATAYADGGWRLVGDPVPSVAGLACEIGISRETCYQWARHEDKGFSDILEKIAQEQERNLIRGGLAGDFNSPITKMMLTKHGYSDKIEQDNTSSDGSMTPQIVERVIVNPQKAE